MTATATTAVIDAWNRENPPGTPVIVTKDDGNNYATTTRSYAEMLGGHTPVIWLVGRSGCVELDRVAAGQCVAKPVAVIYCYADFRNDRCPAKIEGNDYTSAVAACLACSFSKIKHFKRGQKVSEIGKKEMQEPKEWLSTAEITKCDTPGGDDAVQGGGRMNVTCDHCDRTARGSRDELSAAGWTHILLSAGSMRITFVNCPDHPGGAIKAAKRRLQEGDM